MTSAFRLPGIHTLGSLAKHSFLIFGCHIMLLCGYSTVAVGAAHTLSSNGQGWYRSSGGFNGTNGNTFTGGFSGSEFRSWFRFVIPAECEDGVQSAQFTLNSVSGSRGGGGTPHSMSLNDILAANVTSMGTGGGVATFNDMGNGSVATFSVAGNGDINQSISLSAAALTDLENAAGTATRQYALAIQHLNIVPTQYIMGFSTPAVVTATLGVKCSPGATITLNKSIVNNYGGTAIVADFIPAIDGTTTSWGTTSNLAPGTYTVSESSLSGYSAGNWTGDCAANGSITLAAGQDAVCSIVNSDIPATLTLNKTVNNTFGGTANIVDFIPSIDGTATTWGSSVTLAAGAHLVTESSLLGYRSGDWQGDCAADGSITLVLAQNATCSIENRDLGVDLVVSKSVNNLNPTIGDVVVFSLEVKNSGPDVATNATVTDIVPAGFVYQVASIAGGDSRNDSDPTGLGLEWVINSLPVGVTVTLMFSATVQAP